MGRHRPPSDNFICDQCNRPFRDGYQLRRHQLTHSGDPATSKQFQCDHCEKSFKRKDYLQVHLRLHSGARPYKCGIPECGKTFAHSQSLRKHEISHERTKLQVQEKVKKSQPNPTEHFEPAEAEAVVPRKSRGQSEGRVQHEEKLPGGYDDDGGVAKSKTRKRKRAATDNLRKWTDKRKLLEMEGIVSNLLKKKK